MPETSAGSGLFPVTMLNPGLEPVSMIVVEDGGVSLLRFPGLLRFVFQLLDFCLGEQPPAIPVFEPHIVNHPYPDPAEKCSP